MNNSVFQIPNVTHRTAIIGRTGSGKTQQGAWLLSMSPFHKQPYVIVDYKGDALLNGIERVREIGLNDTIPRHPGLYIVKPLPSQGDEVEAWMWKVWKREKTGLFFDEAYNIPDPQKGGSFRALLTQGRSKKIPVICCTQRPAWISRFIFSEADFYSVLHLQTQTDIDRIREFTPFRLDKRLPQYHSRWYDVSQDQSCILAPVPDAATILETFDDRLRRNKHFL